MVIKILILPIIFNTVKIIKLEENFKNNGWNLQDLMVHRLVLEMMLILSKQKIYANRTRSIM